MVVIAIKPYQIEDVIGPIVAKLAQSSKFVVSIAAGWDLNKYRYLFGEQFDAVHIQCTIPNTPMAVSKGVLVTESDNTLSETQTETFEQLFAPISLIERVDSAHMGIAMCVAGCAPAFTDMYIEALADARCEIRFATCHGISFGCEDGGRCGCSISRHGNTPGCHERCRMLAWRHHHQRCRLAGGERVPRGAIIKAVDAIEQ